MTTPGSRPAHVPDEVFISHCSEDKAFVDRLVDVLRSHQIPIWYSRTDIPGTQEWHDEIGRALRRCDWFIIILSPAAADSMWVKRELLYALQQERLEKRIAPLLYRSCAYEQKLSWTLLQMETIDFSRSFDDGCRNLLRVWGLGYRPTDRE